MVQSCQVAGNGGYAAVFLDRPGEEFRGDRTADIRIHGDRCQSLTVRSIASHANYGDPAARHFLQSGADMIGIAGSHENSVKFLFDIGCKQLHIALAKARKCPENQFHLDSAKCRYRCANPRTQGIEKGCNLARKINSDSQSAV